MMLELITEGNYVVSVLKRLGCVLINLKPNCQNSRGDSTVNVCINDS